MRSKTTSMSCSTTRSVRPAVSRRAKATAYAASSADIPAVGSPTGDFGADIQGDRELERTLFRIRELPCKDTG